MRRATLIATILALGLLLPISAGAASQNFDGFTIQYQESDSSRVAMVAEVITSSIQAIQQEIGLRLNNRILVVLHHRADYQAVAGGIRSEAYYDGYRRTVQLLYRYASSPSMADEWINGALRHEITHACHLSYSMSPTPKWFGEGMAMYMELSPAQREQQRLRVEQDGHHNLLGTLASSPYQVGVVGVMYLLDRFGRRTLEDILVRMHGGEKFDGAFEHVTGVTPAGFEQDFRAAMR